MESLGTRSICGMHLLPVASLVQTAPAHHHPQNSHHPQNAHRPQNAHHPRNAHHSSTVLPSSLCPKATLYATSQVHRSSTTGTPHLSRSPSWNPHPPPLLLKEEELELLHPRGAFHRKALTAHTCGGASSWRIPGAPWESRSLGPSTVRSALGAGFTGGYTDVSLPGTPSSTTETPSRTSEAASSATRTTARATETALSAIKALSSTTETASSTTETTSENSEDGSQLPVGTAVKEEAAESHSGGTPKFEWRSHWYAIATSADLDPSRPHPITVLGRRLVLWRDPNATLSPEDKTSKGQNSNKAETSPTDKSVWGVEEKTSTGENSNTDKSVGVAPAVHQRLSTQWRCFLDQCPHRLVPLSEGRIDEKGHLQCSYHGWTFSGSGACTGIPQANKEGAEGRAVGSPRACAAPLPIREERGLLFVWPDETEEGWAKAMSTELPIPEGLETFTMVGTVRDMYYGWETLAENVLDPSHLPFAHHGVGPINRSQGRPFQYISVFSSTEGPEGFSGQYVAEGRKVPTLIEFLAPSAAAYLRVASQKEGGSSVADSPGDTDALKRTKWVGQKGQTPPKLDYATVLFMAPTVPGRSRLIVWEGADASSGIPPWLIPKGWLAHVLKLFFLDGDSFFLHAQERMYGGYHLGHQNVSNETPEYFLPTAADRFVLSYRRWLGKYAGGSVEWPAGFSATPSWQPKEVVLDRFSSHTQHCLTCQKAVAKFRIAQRVCLFLSVLALASTFATFALPQIAKLVIAVAFGGVSFLLGKLIDQFYFTGYDHAER